MSAKSVILCVDDDRIILRSIQTQLNREFGEYYTIETSESGEEAIDLIEDLVRNGISIPILISDQLMPGMNGDELLRKVHYILPETLNILLTGHADISAITSAVNNANLYRYMEKPWDSQDLHLTVKEAIRIYTTDRELEQKNILLERHNNELEELVLERTSELSQEKEKSDKLLLNILPKEIATELKDKGRAVPRHYKEVTILFTDFSSFTEHSTKMTPHQLVETLNECFSSFDEIIERHNLEKIKTIGDSYMCAGGLPIENKTNPVDAINAAIDIRQWVFEWNKIRQKEKKDQWQIRIGLHTGELIAGVIGKRKFVYDIWGDTVNIAARMESTCEPGMIQISSVLKNLLSESYRFTLRNDIFVKGKGKMNTYYVNEIESKNKIYI